MDEATDKRLVRRCLRGDLKAFEQLIDRYQRVVYNTAIQLVGDSMDAEDVTQAVFVKVYEKLDQYKPRYKFFSWIYRIAVNEALNTLKKGKRTESLDWSAISPAASPLDTLEQKEVQTTVREAILELDPEYSVLLVLKHIENFSYCDIAYITDLPESKVKSRLFTARRQLRSVMEHKGYKAYAG